MFECSSVRFGAVIVVAIFVVIVVEGALHIDTAVEITVGLVDHREADRLARPAERDRQRIIATDELGKTLGRTSVPSQHEHLERPDDDQREDDDPLAVRKKPARSVKPTAQSRFLLRTSPAEKSKTAM